MTFIIDIDRVVNVSFGVMRDIASCANPDGELDALLLRGGLEWTGKTKKKRGEMGMEYRQEVKR